MTTDLQSELAKIAADLRAIAEKDGCATDWRLRDFAGRIESALSHGGGGEAVGNSDKLPPASQPPSEGELPELPPFGLLTSGTNIKGYTAEQMREYGEKCRRADSDLAEANAAIVDEIRRIVGLEGKPGNVVEEIRRLAASGQGVEGWTIQVKSGGPVDDRGIWAVDSEGTSIWLAAAPRRGDEDRWYEETCALRPG